MQALLNAKLAFKNKKRDSRKPSRVGNNFLKPLKNVKNISRSPLNRRNNPPI